MTLLEVEKLRLAIGGTPILNGIDLRLDAGKVLGIIGESGSGKSMTALSIMRLLPAGSVATGAIRLNGTELLAQTETQMCAIRGRDVGMVFQEPMTALDPLKTIGAQVAETIWVHAQMSRREAFAEADRVLDRAGLPRDRFPRDRYPHELSGGQRQRVVIASAIALRPKLLIADEPTTALDVTTQARILDLLQKLVDEDGMGLIFITHDLAVVAGLADDVAVMRHGEVVESGPTRNVFRTLAHPYTRELFEASSHVPHRGWPNDPSRDRSDRAETDSAGWPNDPSRDRSDRAQQASVGQTIGQRMGTCLKDHNACTSSRQRPFEPELQHFRTFSRCPTSNCWRSIAKTSTSSPPPPRMPWCASATWASPRPTTASLC